jgi:hypothetical protein
MASPPPPYENITGISRTVMKDNAQVTIENYNGNARPGEIVVDQLNNNVYIGNTNGNLNLLVIGGGSGNSEPAGPVGAIQYNSGGNLFGGTANVTVSGTGVSVVGNVTAGNIVANTIVSNGTGNIYITGNLLPSVGTLNLGLPTVPWQDAYFGPQSITILDATGNIGNSVVIENIAANIVIGTTGFTINEFGTSNPIFRIEALTGQLFSNAKTIIQNTTNADNTFNQGALQVKGGGSVVKDFYVGGNIYGTGNITGGNLTISGTSNLGSNANVKITGGSNGQSLTTDGAGNLSWTTQGSGNVATARGQFWSNVTQTVASANTEYRFSFNNYDANSNVVLGSGASNSRIIINQTGIYNIQFSAQIDKTGSGSNSTAYIWFKRNGIAVPSSAGFFTLDNTIQAVQTWNILANVTTAGDYYEIAYAGSSTNFDFPTLPGNVTVGYPASPSIIVTVTPVGS